ncbi:hypothetical protein [Streptomyces sp. NPDC005969]|uniref:hypothetical protein n=1 Tax=Streptomyces sp. NPDC005969 TaxID=3156722 RepID=UPI0034011F85
MEQASEQRTVGVGEHGLADLAPQDQQLVPQREDLDVFVPLTHRQQPQERERMGDGEVAPAAETSRASHRRPTRDLEIPMPYRKGQHVEYRDQQDEVQRGEVRSAQGSGAQTRYAVQNETTMREDKVSENQIEREL